MIVTRRRAKRFPWGRVLLPVAAILALAIAMSWPPSHGVIVNGPLKPVFGALANTWATVGRPLSFAAQQQQIADRQHEVARLNDTLETDRKAQHEKDARIAFLQSQMAQLQDGPKADPSARSRAVTSPREAPALANSAPDDVKRTAQYWASMDPDKAAAIAQRLPDSYVTRVFAQMTPDDVGDIMNALPARVAARFALVSVAH